ncbi:Nucleoside-diphosphate-sugar epimerase [Glycomyces harbinensis]|uniref:Nucleoside-diphosphate-sugar epimerase n=1 Tax=Glycomyces harbinensis TaxID=58114 RepID=A0A1G7AAZ0_9ACTN|nr:NAD-dependent epimerase/dehydratase family protein [Glycomyces harbinensis]SDE11215.1 Nucleoside-diphosphate-sugar epimerase [Glycomyces harbinensis]
MRAVLLGGTGAIGGATAMLLSEAGWRVEVTGRDRSRMPKAMSEAGVRFHRLERSDARGVERLVGDGADLLVDLVAYTAEDVRALLPAMSSVQCPVLISGRAVYVDDAGRHLNGDEPPQFDRPVGEAAPTLAPAPDGTDPFTREGYGPCKAAAELTALESGLPVTVVRPSKVHGRWARNARTRTIIDRMRSGERSIALAQADTIDHLTAARNAAALINTVADRPGSRILNAADPDTPTAEEIVRAIAAELSWDGRIERVPDGSEQGRHPWQTPMVLDTTAALELGYEPVGKGVELLAEEIRWLVGDSDR